MTISRSDAERIVRIAAAIIVDERGQTLLVRKRAPLTRDHVLPMVRAAREYGGLNP
ncbi:MAG: hypothetical protein QOK17_2942 [Sphingomonadales bacterium]|jgi:hypothetical protein|nr:hypothetical protein [Sphingomonadales bacterium]